MPSGSIIERLKIDLVENVGFDWLSLDSVRLELRLLILCTIDYVEVEDLVVVTIQDRPTRQ